MQLVVDSIKKSFGVHEIFNNVTFTISKGEKVGLVGVNGCGKTTLLRCLLDTDSIDGGSIKYEPNLRLGYVEQGFNNIGHETLWNFMLGSCKEIVNLREKLKDLEKRIEEAKDKEVQKDLLASYTRLETQFELLDGYHYEQNIKKVLIGLGFLEEDWEKIAENFSGGQKTRLMLAAALVNAPDLLILDEPTNHLDIKMTEWLEEYLQAFKGGLLVVSHDRFFLDNVCGKILEMEAGKLHGYKGNYSKYLEQKEIEIVTREAAYEAQQEYITRTEDYIRRFKAGIKSKMARGRQSQLDRLERLDAPVHNEEFSLKLPPASESADKVIVLDDLAVGYENNCLIDNINLTITRGEKVGILGANGTGKTTLLKTILQELPSLKGSAKIGNRVKIGYFSQSYERLNPKQTIMDNFLEEYGYTDEYTRKLLGGMLFRGEDVFKEIGTLSGGQKARLVLLKLVLDGANCLLLDEPTNHLDILAKEAVEAALEIYDGTVLLVSHDRYLVNEIVERIWDVDEHTIKDYKGNYTFYLEQKAKATPVKEVQEKKTESPKENIVEKKKTAPKKEQKEKKYSSSEAEKLLPKVELSIREQEALLKILEQKMSDPIHQQDPKESLALAMEHEQLEKIISDLMEKWEKIMECIE